MEKFRVKCVKGNDTFVLTIRASDNVNAVRMAYGTYKVDYAEIHTEKFTDTYKRKSGSYVETYRRSSSGRGGQVLFS